MASFRLHCFPESGNSYKPALMLALCGVDWEPVFVDFFNGATRDADWRGAVSEMGEAPVLEHDGKRFSQSGVILTYLAEVLGKFGGRDADENREILRWLLFDNHKFTGYFATYRFLRSLAPSAPEPAVLAFFEGRVATAFAIVDKVLGRSAFIAGERPTIADISMTGYLFYPESEHGIDFGLDYPNIAAWLARIRALDGWADPYALMPGVRAAQYDWAS